MKHAELRAEILQCFAGSLSEFSVLFELPFNINDVL